MATTKPTFAKMGLKMDTDVKVITIGEQEIEIKQYLPVNDKLALIGNVISSAADDNNFANPIKLEVFTALEIVFAYTNISFTDKQKEDPVKLYDIMESNGIFNTIIEVEGRKVGPLVDTVEPEDKRLLIGDIFIKITNSVIERLGLDPENTFIAQGTLRPDLIESGNPDISGFAHKIKTHHNDVVAVREARKKGLIVETNADWHKDEVRNVARRLGLEESIAARQPFPGPGLGVRCLGAITRDRLTAVRESDAILREEFAKAGLDKKAWQYNFGFGKIYDFVSPYLLLEYDYVRVFFEYEGKDWMIQMWKGNYFISNGGEVVEFPDFTNGKWIMREPKEIIELD